MRAVRIVREALRDLLLSALSVLILLTAARELLSPPGGAGLWGGTLLFTEHKWPWVIVIVVMLLILWLVARAIGGPRGVLWGAGLWLLRIGFWWGIAALLLFLGIAIYGLATRPIAYLNWGFALSYLLLALGVILLCALPLRRLSGYALVPPADERPR